MKTIRWMLLPLCLLVSNMAHALYYFNDVRVRLVNHADQPFVVDLNWEHGSNWFSTSDAQPVRWSHVSVPAKDEMTSNFAVIVFPKNKHAWQVRVTSQSGTDVASLSDPHNDLVEVGSANHEVTVEIAKGGCHVSVTHNGITDTVNAADSTVCIHGSYVPSIVASQDSVDASMSPESSA